MLLVLLGTSLAMMTESAARMGKKRGTDRSTNPAQDGTVVHRHEATLSQEWPFETHFNDHFETPARAYRDIKPVLRVVARTCDIETAALRVYDPYYCRGKRGLCVAIESATGTRLPTNAP